jgi:hypothetical protein
MQDAHLGFVVTTLGRADHMQSLLTCLSRVAPGAWVGIADQSDGDHVTAMAAAQRDVLDISYVRTPRGASIGRNAAAALAPPHVSHLVFPNDSSSYPQDFARAAVDRIGDAHVLAATYRDDKGPRREFASGVVRVDRDSAWIPIEPAMVVRRDAFDAVGGFDERLGTGAPGPWQSSGGGDLLLRIAAELDPTGGAELRLAPDLVVGGVGEGSGLTPSGKRWKSRAYGRGYGFVLRRHGYSPTQRARAVLGAATLGLRSPSRFSLRDGWYAALGRAEGATGVLLSARDRAAVER